MKQIKTIQAQKVSVIKKVKSGRIHEGFSHEFTSVLIESSESLQPIDTGKS